MWEKMRGEARGQRFSAKSVRAQPQLAPDRGEKKYKGGRVFPFIKCSICNEKMTRRGFFQHNYIAHDREGEMIELR